MANIFTPDQSVNEPNLMQLNLSIRLVHSVPDLQIHRVNEFKVDTTEHDKHKDDK